MIGTGVFTSLGFQLSAVQNSWTILLLWLSGGLLSLFGAFAYAELGTHFRQSGGDYIYLSRVFHPVMGYLSAWAGLVVGFSAPVALAAMLFTKYLAPFGAGDSQWLAITIIVSTGLMHSFTISHSSRFHNNSTGIKILFIVGLLAIGFFSAGNSPGAYLFTNSWQQEVLKPGFAVSMLYVFFAYSGWNAAAYVAGEMDNPSKNLPRALIGSTLFVALLYVLFQLVLLKHATIAEMEGREAVTFIAFNNLLGNTGGKWVSFFIALQLIATISAYLWVGPRVTHALAKEHRLWQSLAKTNKHQVPVYAIWAHVIIAVVLVLTGSFEKVLLYAGFVLQLMVTLTVAASLFLKTAGDTSVFKSPFKPWLQLLFLLFSAWVLVFTFIDKPLESAIGIGILLLGLVMYCFDTPVKAS